MSFLKEQKNKRMAISKIETRSLGWRRTFVRELELERALAGCFILANTPMEF